MLLLNAQLVLVFLSSSLIGQTAGLISSQAGFGNSCSPGAATILDPNGDCSIATTLTGEFSGGIVPELSEFEELSSGPDIVVPWRGFPVGEGEPSGDPVNGGSCNNTDIVCDNMDPSSFSYYTIFNSAGVEYIAFRIRVADQNSGNFGFSVLLDTDGYVGQFGANPDPNYTCGNPGFEKESDFR